MLDVHPDEFMHALRMIIQDCLTWLWHGAHPVVHMGLCLHSLHTHTLKSAQTPLLFAMS